MNRLVDAAFASSGPGGLKDTSASVSETDLLTDVGRRQRLREKAEKTLSEFEFCTFKRLIFNFLISSIRETVN